MAPLTITIFWKILRIVPPSTRRFHWQYLAPRYWPIWLGLGLMKLMAALPFPWQVAMGGQIGRWIGKAARRRRRIAKINLELCFPELSPRQRSELLDAHFAALGIGLFETAMAWWAPDEKLRGLARVEGIEHLQRALDRGKGVILLTGHFTTLELGARFITWHQPFHAMYRSHKNLLYEAVMRRERERRSRFPPLPHEDLRGLLRAFRKGTRGLVRSRSESRPAQQRLRAVLRYPRLHHHRHIAAGGFERRSGGALFSPALAGNEWL